MDAVKNRFMFDTSAINALYRAKGDDEMKIYASKKNGFEYYFTETQLEELENNINSKEFAGKDFVSREAAERAIKMLRLVSKIQVNHVGRIATLTWNRWLLNGTFELLPDNEDRAQEMYRAILADNSDKFYNDAIIALTGIVNGCTVVVNDGRFRKIVNQYFPGRGITYDEFFELVKAEV